MHLPSRVKNTAIAIRNMNVIRHQFASMNNADSRFGEIARRCLIFL